MSLNSTTDMLVLPFSLTVESTGRRFLIIMLYREFDNQKELHSFPLLWLILLLGSETLL